MSRQFRNRAAGIALAALFAVAPLLTTESAHAEQTGRDREVVFGGGGVLGLSCAAQPNVETMRVPAGATLRVVNRTGHRAKLRLNGDSQGQLADDGATQVVFRRGTVAVAMEPDCMLRDATTPVLVTASPSAVPPSSTPNPPPPSAPPTTDSAAPPSSPSGSSAPVATSASATGGGSPSVPGSPAGNPSRPSGSGTATRQANTAATTTATSMPQGGTTAPTGTGTTAGGTTAATPTFAGMPPGDDPTISSTGSVDALPPTDLASASAAAAAAETVAALEPIGRTGSDGLLAAIATICVLGVGAGAIRAFVAQRASGTTMA